MIGGFGPLADPDQVARELGEIPGIGPHLPIRRSWTCAHDDCGQPWPCGRAKLAIMEFLPTRLPLTHLMVRVLAAAVQDVPAARPEALYHRILSWTRR